MPFDGLDFPQLEKINAVIDLLTPDNSWGKHYLYNKGRYCIRGALLHLHAHDDLEPFVIEAVREVALRRLKRPVCRIEAFNDYRDTTHAYVVEALHLTRDKVITKHHQEMFGTPTERRRKWQYRGRLIRAFFSPR